MPKLVTILRPFTFSRKAVGPNGEPTEHKFRPRFDESSGKWIPTEVELSDDMLENPWVTQDFADGAIERPEATAARVDAHKQSLAARMNALKQEMGAADPDSKTAKKP